jgi:hypothetical protein
MLVVFPVMDRHDVLALVGIIVGVPGLLYFFLSGKWVVGILTVLIIAVVLTAAWYVNQPPITVINNNKNLAFDDKEAHTATQRSDLKLRANHKGVQMFRLGSLSTDGSVRSVTIDDQPPSRQQVTAGEIEIIKEFRNPLERGQVETLRVSTTYIDSFKDSTESFTHVVAHKTKKLSLTVNFHAERPCRTAKAFLRYGGQVHKAMAGIEVSADGRRARLEVKRPKLGSDTESGCIVAQRLELSRSLHAFTRFPPTAR